MPWSYILTTSLKLLALQLVAVFPACSDYAVNSSGNEDYGITCCGLSCECRIADHAVNSYTDTSFAAPNSNNDSSFEIPNSALAANYPETHANSDFRWGGIDGPCYESVVATGWD
ncbi:hypothetical protein RJT34_16511 [Clitoria ternatea]|uniref:Uncharacterized protein n=1 Tax=Clitoria ternatea TaxID=43366 RepID=A0AAN9J8G8_CLITE